MSDENTKKLFEMINLLEKRIEILEHVNRTHQNALEDFALNLKVAGNRLLECIDE